MIRRPMWLATGAVLGVAGTLWAEQRVRRTVRQAATLLTPAGAGAHVARSVRGAGDRVRDAVQVGRAERARLEAELWARLDPDRPGARPLRRGGPAGRPDVRRRADRACAPGNGLRERR